MPLSDTDFTRRLRPLLAGDEPTSATVLLCACVRHFGVESLNWDPLTLLAEFDADFNIELPSDVFDRLMSAQSVLTNDLVYYNVPAFDETISCFNGAGLGSDDDMPTVEELCMTVAEIYLLDPEPAVTEREAGRWGHDIRNYCRLVLDDEGFSFSPRVLSWVPNRTPDASTGVEPDEHAVASVFAEQEARTEEMDIVVDRHVERILQQLLSLGIDPQKSLE